MIENLLFFSCPGSTPLHLAARGGSLDCIRKLLAWGADRLQRDASGYSLILLLIWMSKLSYQRSLVLDGANEKHFKRFVS